MKGGKENIDSIGFFFYWISDIIEIYEIENPTMGFQFNG